MPKIVLNLIEVVPLLAFGNRSFNDGKVVGVDEGGIGSSVDGAVDGAKWGKLSKIKGIKILVLAFFVGKWGLKLI